MQLTRVVRQLAAGSSNDNENEYIFNNAGENDGNDKPEEKVITDKKRNRIMCELQGSGNKRQRA